MATKCKVEHDDTVFTDISNIPALKLRLEDPSYDVNETCGMGATSLMQAASGDNIEAIELLLGHPDIDPNIRDCEGRTALHCAVMEGNLDYVQLFLSCDKVDPNIPDGMGNRVLSYACWNEEDKEILKFLLHHPRVDKNAFGEFVYSSEEEEEDELGFDTIHTAFETACMCSPAYILQWFLDCEDLKIGKEQTERHVLCLSHRKY